MGRDRYKKLGYNVEVKDGHVKIFMGSDYKIDTGSIETIGELAGVLETIIENLRELDHDLEIEEVYFDNDGLHYVLEKGIILGDDD